MYVPTYLEHNEFHSKKQQHTHTYHAVLVQMNSFQYKYYYSFSLTTAPFPTLAVVLGVLIPLIVIAVVIAIVVILLLAWWDRRNRGQYFPGKEEHGKTNLDRELNDNTNGLHGWEGSKEKAYYDDDDV
jgi:nitrogen fixation-related uncharacterized protein